ncbi:MAG: hypothetical protein F4Y57_07055 [Acidobacteria bacterium]|nr:hypothetical protein [Acidobacteriota bacterium]
MAPRVLALLTVLPLVFGIAWLAPVAAAQDHTTPWGDPDLQGFWTNTTTTPLQRPDDLAGKETLTSEELAVRDPQVAEAVSFDDPQGRGRGGYNEFWVERGSLLRQTSLIVDPPDGRLPAMTTAAQRRHDAFMARWTAPPTTWEDLNILDRCITRGLPGAMIPGFYNHNYLIVQTPDHVVVQLEMIHDARIIPLDGRAHLPGRIRQWLGDPRGRWEGETLVVESTNFSPKTEQRPNFFGIYFPVFSTGANLNFVERFTRVDADTLDYRFTVTDAAVDSRPWTAATPMTRIEQPLFEYACHEGNYAMANGLSGTRAAETDATGSR